MTSEDVCDVNDKLKDEGHLVVNGTYAGDLLCTGLTHWRVADLTCRFISSKSHLFKDKNVLELGCGLGLCSILCAHLVGKRGSVISTDRDVEVLQIAQANIHENDVRSIARTSLLSWSDHKKANIILNDFIYSKNNSHGNDNITDNHDKNNNKNDTKNNDKSNVYCDKKDDKKDNKKYNKKDNNKGFDIIVGSDCLYSGMKTVDELFSVVSILLADNYDSDNNEIMEDNVSDNCDDNYHSESDTNDKNNKHSSNCGNNEDNSSNNNNDNSNNENNIESATTTNSTTTIDNVDTTTDLERDYLDPTSIDGGGWMKNNENNDNHNNDKNISDDYENDNNINNNTNNNNNINSSTNTTDNKTVSSNKSTINVNPVLPVQPVFILGYERRLGGADIDMSEMFKIAGKYGFAWCIAEDSVVDIFGNETSEQTLFWEQCVLLFTRVKREK